jgi:hypothetical protein
MADGREYEIALTVSRVADEHAAYVAQVLMILQGLFTADGSDVDTSVSAERGRDGVERVHELLRYVEDDDDDKSGSRGALLGLVRWIGEKQRGGELPTAIPLPLHAQIREALGDDLYTEVAERVDQ